ncbi:Tc toxin subunit A [Pseudomonas sp. p1(2021b)]|uniref:Tc toxin subunit A-related protein n=1 Tax=Pseudomonas sp. p1(2021b) TaxID=2874628 RepID=UPI001CCBB796|nr:neuraminidase-like domain-containing protein [Pseudomonas sp. p1(2021b)]UBM23532.1 Tc toxin subunit A [Pseudomonas sp. p1(2021b)]
MASSDAAVHDYKEWFGGRAAKFAAPGSVASMFSPAAYLTTLYREAKKLYPEGNPWHIDTRRPDLKHLVLSQVNLDTPVSALSLSNAILMERLGEHGDTLEGLSSQVGFGATPYHHQHTRLRQAYRLKDPDFKHLWAATDVAKHFAAPSLAGLCHDIPPALYGLLTDEITDENADEKFATYFPGTVPQDMLRPARLRDWFGLSDPELKAFIDGGAQVEDERLGPQTHVSELLNREGVTYQLGVGSASTAIHYAYLFFLGGDRWELSFSLKQAGAIEFILEEVHHLRVSPQMLEVEAFVPDTDYRYAFEWKGPNEDRSYASYRVKFTHATDQGRVLSARFTTPKLAPAQFLLRLNKVIRLHKATGLGAEALARILHSVDPVAISERSLAVLTQTVRLAKRYAIPHEQALVMGRQLIAVTARGGELSQYDRLFNDPALVEGGLDPADYVVIDLRPGQAAEQADIKATLKRACQVDDEGLYQLGRFLALEAQASDAADDEVRFATTHEDLSGLYTLSLWARLHGLAPGELGLLLETFGAPRYLRQADTAEWLRLLGCVEHLASWLQARGWTVSDLVLMTRDVGDIPPSPEITNLIKEMQAALANAELPGEPVMEDYLRALTPLIASTFGLSGETAARALLIWADRGKPGGLSLQEVGERLKSEDPEASEEPEEPSDPVADPQIIAFTYGLAQMALIVHASGVTADVLAVLVTQPHVLGAEAVEGAGGNATLKRSVATVEALTDFSTWLKARPESASALMAALVAEGVTPALLATATGQAEGVVAEAARQAALKRDVENASALANWQEIAVVRQWTDLATTLGVRPETLATLLVSPEAWAQWQALANSVEAGLSPSQVKRAQAATEAPLSKALAGVLAARGNLGVERLNQHLLLDSLNSAQVTTSRIAEAMAALQLFIHRTLSEPEDKHGLNSAALDRPFFRDWTRWNARYATWSAGQMLMYYPENYIDPTVRLGQTKAMDDMLQVLGQAQINGDTVGDAFHGYLSAFEEVANLETISGYYNGREPQEADSALDKTWFIGRSRGEPREYWWRTVDESKRDKDTGALPANAWRGWTKIDLAPQVVGRLIRPVIYNERLYLMWVERQEHILTRNEQGQPDQKEHVWAYKLAWLRYDGTWSAPLSYPMSAENVKELESVESRENLSLFLVNLSGLNALVAGIYDRGVGAGDEAKEYGGIEIREDFTSTSIALLNDLQQVPHWLDTALHTGLCSVFDRQDRPVAKDITPASGKPTDFVSFDLSDASVRVIDTSAAQAGSYSLRLDTTLSVEAVRPEVANPWITKLVKGFEGLAKQTTPVRALALTQEGAFLVRHENAEDWGYLCVSFKQLSNFDVFFSIIADVYDVPVGEGTGVRHESGYILCRFKINTANYPLSAINIKFRYGSSFVSHEVNVAKLLEYSGMSRELVTPSRYLNPPGKVGKSDIRRIVYGVDETRSVSETAKVDFDLALGAQQAKFSSVLDIGRMSEWSGKDQVSHTMTLTVGEVQRHWRINLYKQPGTETRPAEWGARLAAVTSVKSPIIGETAEGAQYFKRGTSVTRLNTLFARKLTERAALGIDTILSYDTQQMPEPVIEGSDASPMMDFGGANALYFWELFYYTPMMVMQRFLQEERFDLAEQWLKYIFNPAGYTVNGHYTPRLWNVRPLEEDTAWNDEPLAVLDPDAVAQNDPMHYKLNAFMRLLDITLGRGDAAYRKLERDTLSEAKVWYQRALRLLGDEPWIEPSTDWDDPQLGDAASQQVLDDRMDALAMMAEGIRAEDVVKLRAAGPARAEAGRTLFLPEANRMLLEYWEALRIRLYNLRHNLTLDGQPLNLALYATPADPKALWADAVAAEAGGANALPPIDNVPALRFIPLVEGARTMTSHLMLFGNAMRLILERQDAEGLLELLSTQGVELATRSVELQEQSLKELDVERKRITALMEVARTRRDHYRALYDENMNTGEKLALGFAQTRKALTGVWGSLAVTAGLVKTFPNVFGTSNGGGRPSGPLQAAGTVAGLTMTGLEIASETIDKCEAYRRRRQDWEIQYKNAAGLMAVLQVQLEALTVRETSINLQIAHARSQETNAQVQLAFHQGKATSKALYSWLRARLASIFYTYYDLTVSRCLMAQKALQWEMGDNTRYLRTGTWNGAWSGLLCGEGLMLALGQMEDAWVRWQKRELEVTRDVSLAKVFDGMLLVDGEPVTLQDAIQRVLNEEDVDCTLALGSLTFESHKLSVQFGLKDLGLAQEFEDGKCRIRRIAVSLEGPNVESSEQVRARLMTNYLGLPSGCHQSVISHARKDDGLFPQEGGDAATRWLPFEGLTIASANDEDDKTTLSLTFADAKGQQVLKELSDITLHIQFTVR